VEVTPMALIAASEEPILHPRILSTAVYSNDYFNVFVGLGRDRDTLPHYLCINVNTDVVEFEAESYFVARSWADHFETQMKELDRIQNPKPITVTEEQADGVVQLDAFRKPDKLN